MLKIYYKGQTLLQRSTDHFGHVNLFVNLTLLNIFAVYSLSLSIIIFMIITKNSKISLKLPIQGQQPNNRLFYSSEHFRAGRSWPDKQFIPVRIALNTLVSEILAKIYILPLCSIFSHGGYDFWRNRKENTNFI